MGRVYEAQLAQASTIVGAVGRRWVHDPHALEDVTQEVMARLIAASHRVEPDAWAAYAGTITLNFIRSAHRSAGYEAAKLERAAIPRPAPHQGNQRARRRSPPGEQRGPPPWWTTALAVVTPPLRRPRLRRPRCAPTGRPKPAWSATAARRPPTCTPRRAARTRLAAPPARVPWLPPASSAP
ncbi:MAG: hypothetical protein GEV08_18685 [Acidimicrobiia bacterium]|nr:hypothetical protein [Acidimicrobiia bacterium]